MTSAEFNYVTIELTSNLYNLTLGNVRKISNLGGHIA